MKIPAEAVLTGHLLVVEYLDSDGTFNLKFESTGTGVESLGLGKTLEFIEYARVQALSPMISEIVSEHFEYEEVDVDLSNEDEAEDESEYEDEAED